MPEEPEPETNMEQDKGPRNISVYDLISQIKTEDKDERETSKTTFGWLPADAKRRKELRKKIADGGRQSLTDAERKEALAHGLVT